MKRSKLLLASWILTLIYLIYIIAYFGNMVLSSSSDMEMVVGGVAFMVVMPHLICVFIGFIFNIIGWSMKARWAGLVAGIMYAVSIFLMIVYIFFVLLQMIFCFVAFAKMKQQKAAELSAV